MGVCECVCVFFAWVSVCVVFPLLLHLGVCVCFCLGVCVLFFFTWVCGFFFWRGCVFFWNFWPHTFFLFFPFVGPALDARKAEFEKGEIAKFYTPSLKLKMRE